MGRLWKRNRCAGGAWEQVCQAPAGLRNRRAVPTPSWPGLTRPPTRQPRLGGKPWMPGRFWSLERRPGMTFYEEQMRRARAGLGNRCAGLPAGSRNKCAGPLPVVAGLDDIGGTDAPEADGRKGTDTPRNRCAGGTDAPPSGERRYPAPPKGPVVAGVIRGNRCAAEQTCRRMTGGPAG